MSKTRIDSLISNTMDMAQAYGLHPTHLIIGKKATTKLEDLFNLTYPQKINWENIKVLGLEVVRVDDDDTFLLAEVQNA